MDLFMMPLSPRLDLYCKAFYRSILLLGIYTERVRLSRLLENLSRSFNQWHVSYSISAYRYQFFGNGSKVYMN